MRAYRFLFGLLPLLLLPLLGGCWDARELNSRAIVSGIGFDAAPGGYRVTMQIIIADEISGKKSRGGTPVSVYQATGRSVVEAIRNVSRKVPRLISTAQTRLVVISEELARGGISDIVDFLDRDSELRLSTKMYIAPKHVQARDIVSALTPLGKIPAYALAQKTDLTAGELGANFPIEIDDVIRELLVPGGGPVINGLDIEGNLEESDDKGGLENARTPSIVTLSKLAIFKGDKLYGWMNRDESQGLVWIKGEMKKTILFVKPESGSEAMTVEVIASHTKIKLNLDHPLKPVVQIEVKPQLSIREAGISMDLRSQQELRKIEKASDEVIAGKLKAAVRKAKQYKSDVFGFGEAIERKSPSAWKKIRSQWEKLFPNVEVVYKVESVIRNSQLRDRSYKYGK